MPTQPKPKLAWRIYAGGKPWVLVAVVHDFKAGYAFSEKHRSIHPKCPLLSEGFTDTIGVDDWTIFD